MGVGGSNPSGRAILQEKANLLRLAFFFARPRISGSPQRGGRSLLREAALRKPQGLTLPDPTLFKQKADSFAVGLLLFVPDVP
ncbi:MAG TPA: hypothetical protein VGE64_08245 [Xanthomonadaceae bacterium]